MPRVKTFDYPNLSIDEAIRAIEILVNQPGKQVSNPESFASLLGHSSAKSGTFLVKLGDLRKYGLVESRGIIATSLAENLVVYESQEARQKAINQMIMNVDLWKQLYSRIAKNFPADDKFWIQLAEATGTDKVQAHKEADNVRKKYKEVMTYYNEGINNSNDETPDETNNEDAGNKNMASQSMLNNTNMSMGTPNEKFMEFAVGNVQIRTGKDLEDIEDAISFLETAKRRLEKQQKLTKEQMDSQKIHQKIREAKEQEE